MTSTGARAVGTRSGSVAVDLAAAAGKIAAIGRRPAAAVVASSAFAHKAMSAPAVAVAPTGPWAHAQEDAVVEVPRPVKAIGRARVWRIVVVAILANWLNTNADKDL